MSDGAAALLIGRRSAVEARGLPVLGVLRASAVVGVPPDLMGVGPAYAIPVALEQAGEICTIEWSRVLSDLKEIKNKLNCGELYVRSIMLICYIIMLIKE